ncbi:hypothetical protein LZC95_40220 [Pendulispora brunnea]|uniref:Lipoprotein n=1 Tax=Pendulispora brunnea TaxID=2905690 RepID=A0ABZ2K8H1_9BACT
MLRKSSVIAFCVPALACLAMASTGCEDDDDWRHGDAYGGWVNTPPPNSGTTTPILAEVDTDQTLNANPGEGVGIYTEYSAGGHWYIWWTCDTNRDKAHRPCTFDVDVHVESGKVSNVRGDRLLTSDSVNASSNGTDVGAHTVTTTAVAGILFDSDPGAVIQLSGYVDGNADPAYFFFVQNGQVNGGYTGRLTNPLRLQGSRP